MSPEENQAQPESVEPNSQVVGSSLHESEQDLFSLPNDHKDEVQDEDHESPSAHSTQEHASVDPAAEFQDHMSSTSGHIPDADPQSTIDKPVAGNMSYEEFLATIKPKSHPNSPTGTAQSGEPTEPDDSIKGTVILPGRNRDR